MLITLIIENDKSIKNDVRFRVENKNNIDF